MRGYGAMWVGVEACGRECERVVMCDPRPTYVFVSVCVCMGSLARERERSF